MKVVEKISHVDANGRLQVDLGKEFYNKDVRISIVVKDQDEDSLKTEWNTFLTNNPVFNFLNDDAEDIYSIADGKPYKK